MTEDIEARLRSLPQLSTIELRKLWRKYFHRDPPPGMRKDLMLRVVGHRLQEEAYGEIYHRGQCHDGEHEGIVPIDLWEKVQTQLSSDNQGRRTGLKINTTSLLVGLVQDAMGNRFVPSHTRKNGKRYRYYVCKPDKGGSQRLEKPLRIAAHELEKLVCV